jgi:hypothetical protein
MPKLDDVRQSGDQDSKSGQGQAAYSPVAWMLAPIAK